MNDINENKHVKMPRINFYSFVTLQINIENNLRITLIWWMNMRDNMSMTKQLDYNTISKLHVPDRYNISEKDVRKKNEEDQIFLLKKESQQTDTDRA